jgi:hypothetical protein
MVHYISLRKLRDDVADLLEYTALEDIGDSVLTCKTLWSHAWSKNPTPRHIKGDVARMATYIICLRCTRCRRERYEYLNSRGERITKPQYRDPVGYPHTRRASGDDFRAECIRRNVLVSTYNGKE